MNESRAREEICRVGRSLFDRGYVHATAGNISMRLEEGGFLITPTDACLGFLQSDKLARIERDGTQTSGARASKTLALHRRIYEAAGRFDPETRCVIHTHSTHCVALSLAAAAPAVDGTEGLVRWPELLPALTPYFVMKVGRVPVIDYRRPGDPQAAELAADAITAYGERGTPIRAVMLSRLGPNVWHETPAAAMAVLEELEETARLQTMASGLQGNGQGAVKPLQEDAIQELRAGFGARW